jgi:hypothetical protein
MTLVGFDQERNFQTLKPSHFPSSHVSKSHPSVVRVPVCTR